jgi:hypothetical protein
MTPAQFCKTLLPLLPIERADAIIQVETALRLDGVGVPKWTPATVKVMKEVLAALQAKKFPSEISKIIEKFPPHIYL